MSFDDGVVPDVNIDTLRARLHAAAKGANLTWPEVCRLAHVPIDVAERAFELGTDGLPGTLGVFQQLSMALGQDADWLMLGCTSGDCAPPSMLLRLRQRVWEYIYKAEIPLAVGKQFEAWATRRFSSVRFPSPQAAYRRGVPQNLKDVARLYEEFERVSIQSGSL